MGIKQDENVLSQRIEQLGRNLAELHIQFTPRQLIILSRLYRELDNGLSGRDIEALLKSSHSVASRIAQQLSNNNNANYTNVDLCTYDFEEGMGGFKTLRFTTAGLRWYEENVLGPFLAE